MLNRAVPRKLYRDPVFITGAYFVVSLMLSIAISMLTFLGESPEGNGITPNQLCTGWLIAGDLTYLLNCELTIVAAALIAAIPWWMILAFGLSTALYMVDIYFFLGPDTYQVEQLLLRFDFWSMFAVSAMLITAILRPGNSRPVMLAIIGWMVLIFGNVLMFGVLRGIGRGQEVLVEPRFIPLLAALIFWIPALWSGSRPSSSQQ
ncbi:MAG: hypothetical protein WC712_00775 [Candidatus Brocadiia bacterium]